MDLRFGYMEDQDGDAVTVMAVVVTAVYDLGEGAGVGTQSGSTKFFRNQFEPLL